MGEHAPQFVGEQAFRAQLGSLVKAVAEHLKLLQTRNSARLDTRCKAVREALRANATALVKPLLAKSTDEKGGWVRRAHGDGQAQASVRPSVRFDDHDLTLSPIHDLPPKKALEGAVASVMAVRAGFAEAVHPLGPTVECKAHDRCVDLRVPVAA